MSEVDLPPKVAIGWRTITVVYAPAMRGYFNDKFTVLYGGPDWLEPLLVELLDGKRKKPLTKTQNRMFTKVQKDVLRGRTEAPEVFEPRHFWPLVELLLEKQQELVDHRVEDAQSWVKQPALTLGDVESSVEDSRLTRNAIEHYWGNLTWTQVRHAILSCRNVLEAIDDMTAVQRLDQLEQEAVREEQAEQSTGPSNAEMDAPKSRSPETQSEAEGSERERDPAPLPGGSETDPERHQQGRDERARLEAAAATEQLGHEQRAPADVGEARRIASSTQGGSSDGGGGSGAATLAGTGDDDPLPLANEGGDLQEPGKRWPLPSRAATMKTVKMIVDGTALAIAIYLIITALPGGSPSAVAPAIDGIINCEPPSPRVGDDVICTAALSGGEPDSWFWSVNGTPT